MPERRRSPPPADAWFHAGRVPHRVRQERRPEERGRPRGRGPGAVPPEPPAVPALARQPGQRGLRAPVHCRLRRDSPRARRPFPACWCNAGAKSPTMTRCFDPWPIPGATCGRRCSRWRTAARASAPRSGPEPPPARRRARLPFPTQQTRIVQPRTLSKSPTWAPVGRPKTWIPGTPLAENRPKVSLVWERSPALLASPDFGLIIPIGNLSAPGHLSWVRLSPDRPGPASIDISSGGRWGRQSA